MDCVTIDFEASCLPCHGRSFPIELGIAGPHGVFSWLIRPHAAWRDWDWTQEAFLLHGITRDQLHDEGLPAETVLAEALQAIGDARVIADSTLDRTWWATLCDGAGPSFGRQGRLVLIDHIVTVFDALGVSHAEIMAAQGMADQQCPQRHRAGVDAHWLWTLISVLRGACASVAKPYQPCAPSDLFSPPLPAIDSEGVYRGNLV